MDNIIKNPTFIAVVAGVITYTYIVWKKKQNKKYNKNSRKHKKDQNEVVMAGIVAVIVWFIVYGYIHYKNPNNKMNQSNQMNQLNQSNQSFQQNVPTYKLVKDISDSPKSFTMMNPVGGIAFPHSNANMPDLFIDHF